MRKIMMLTLAAATLAACDRGVPADARGVGFGNYDQFELERAQREAALATNGVVPPPQVTGLQNTGAISSQELAAVGIGAQTAAAAPSVTIRSADPNAAQLSDEQDFEAVISRETAESDAQRLEALAAAREEVLPSAVPDRPADTGPNIVAYALNAPNVKGQEWYSRFVFSSQSRYLRNCAAYANADAAQRDFLARGGPERDRLGLDPDGDGFACGWDPAPFRAAAGT